MPKLLWIGLALLAVFLIACGGDDDDDSSAAGSGDSQPSADNASSPSDNGSDDSGGGGDSGATSGGGSGMVTIGDETFQFEISCQFGTGIIDGTGENQDGTPAYLRGSMPKDSNGQPTNDPSAVDMQVKVGTAELIGQATYDYTVQSTLGSVSQYTDDGSHTDGSAEFSYGDGSGAKEGFTHGDLVSGTWDITCP
jgi:hypothetical protein